MIKTFEYWHKLHEETRVCRWHIICFFLNINSSTFPFFILLSALSSLGTENISSFSRWNGFSKYHRCAERRQCRWWRAPGDELGDEESFHKAAGIWILISSMRSKEVKYYGLKGGVWLGLILRRTLGSINMILVGNIPCSPLYFYLYSFYTILPPFSYYRNLRPHLPVPQDLLRKPVGRVVRLLILGENLPTPRGTTVPRRASARGLGYVGDRLLRSKTNISALFTGLLALHRIEPRIRMRCIYVTWKLFNIPQTFTGKHVRGGANFSRFAFPTFSPCLFHFCFYFLLFSFSNRRFGLLWCWLKKFFSQEIFRRER